MKLNGLWAVGAPRLVRLFHSWLVRSVIAENVDDANEMLASGWRLNNVDTRNSRWAGDPSKIRFMLVRLSRLGILMSKCVNQNILVRPIGFGAWPLDSNGDQMPALVPNLLGNIQVAVNGGFKFSDFHNLGQVHGGMISGGGDSSNSLPNSLYSPTRISADSDMQRAVTVEMKAGKSLEVNAPIPPGGGLSNPRFGIGFRIIRLAEGTGYACPAYQKIPWTRNLQGTETGIFP